jgi:hypothetical protein
MNTVNLNGVILKVKLAPIIKRETPLPVALSAHKALKAVVYC